MAGRNETHDTELTSWVESANEPGNDFPIQNLPLAIFRRGNSDETFRGGVAIGDYIVDLSAAIKIGVFEGAEMVAAKTAAQSTLNDFMAMGHQAWSALRFSLSKKLRSDANNTEAIRTCLVPQSHVEYGLPCTIGDYTDFFASIHHASKAGSVYRPDKPLSPNYKWIPISYHGRVSSIGLAGELIHRPWGQVRRTKDDPPILQSTEQLDHELELGFYVGHGNARGDMIDIDSTEEHVFGVSLLNDWSARDIQAWETRPLGPFLGKNFATTVTPWIVTMEALAPYRAPFSRTTEDPQPLDYLTSSSNSSGGAIDIHLEVLLQTPSMRRSGAPAERISQSNFVDCYWTMAQLVAHHTINGCNLRPGDLIASGTQSGPDLNQGGCLLELTRGGQKPLTLSNGETRGFLEDGDTIVLKGWCEREGAARIGLGELRNTVVSSS